MVVKYPNPILRKKCQKVEKLEKKHLKVIDDLIQELSRACAAGLAAPQAGQAFQIFGIQDLISCSCREGCSQRGSCQKEIRICINPKIISSFGQKKVRPRMLADNGQKEDFFEGCLSFPGLYGTVKRWLRIKVEYQTINEKRQLEKKEEELEGFLAIVFQHELDHLKGVLFIDHIKKESGQVYQEKEGRLAKVSLASIIKD